MKPILNAVKQKQKANRIKSVDICRACNISPTDFSSWKAERISLSSDKLERIVEYMDLL